jgi:uncharacterized membrane protein
MEKTLLVISTSLHSIATAAFIGYFFVMTGIINPIFSRIEATGLKALSEISKSSRWWLYAAMGILALTGIHLTLSDASYSGIGQFDSPWSLLMLAKHIVIVVMLLIGFWFNVIRRAGPGMLSTSNSALGFKRFNQYCISMSICGILILVLTTIGQMI